MLTLLLFLEGALVCTVDLSKHSDITYRDQYPRASKLHNENADEESVMSFIIGRQILVIFTVFIAAQLTGMPFMVNFPFSNSPFPSAFQSVFLAPGVLGGVVTVIFAQLTSQMIATNYPVQFLSIPGIWLVIKVCKFFDWIGLVHVTWIVADLICRLFRLNDDVTVRLKEYDFELHHRKVLGTVAQTPSDEIDLPGNWRCDLHLDNPKYVPPHALVCSLIKAFNDKPQYQDQVLSILSSE